MIKLSKVKKQFGKIVVLDIDDLTVEQGTNNVIVGLNGAGKSTLLLLLAGLAKPTSGEIRIDGSVPGSKPARRKVSFVPDQPALFDDLTLNDQLQYVARLSNQTSLNAISSTLIEAMNAGSLLDKFPRSMSKGQRQKSSLLVATARPFEILLLDEPTSGLDETSQEKLMATLHELADNGKTVISSSHNTQLINQAGRQILIQNGSTNQIA